MNMQEFIEYVRIVSRRWWLLLILCVTTLGAIWISFRAAPLRFEATVRFLVNAPPPSNVTLYPGFDRPSQDQQIAYTQATFMETIKSPTVLQRTAKAVGTSMSGAELGRRVTVDKPLKSGFVWVTVLGNNPQEAADLANALVDTAKQYYGQIQAEPAASSREFISKQVKETFQGLQAAKQALADFKQSNRISDLAAEIASQRSIVWNLVLEQGKAAAIQQTERLSAYDQIISQQQMELQRLAALSDQYGDLQDRIKRAEAYYGFLVDKETEAKLKENEVLGTSYIQVIEPAYPSREAVSPFNVKIFALGGVLSLVVTIVLAFVLEYIEAKPKKVRERVSAFAIRS